MEEIGKEIDDGGVVYSGMNSDYANTLLETSNGRRWVYIMVWSES